MDDNRLNAAANIARWRGWTRRHYSILEHMIVGTSALQQLGASRDAQCWFLLHDMHETEIIGDVPTPDKRDYCNDDFHVDCAAFDREIQRAYNLTVTETVQTVVDSMDRHCAIMEHAILTTRMCLDVPRPDGSRAQTVVNKLIRTGDQSRYALMRQWHDHARRLNLYRVAR